MTGRREASSPSGARPTLISALAGAAICLAGVVGVLALLQTKSGTLQTRLIEISQPCNIGEDNCSLESDAPLPDPSSYKAELTLAREVADYAKWQNARTCLNVSSGCAALRCYNDYLAEAVTLRVHGEEAESARARLLLNCGGAAPAEKPLASLEAANGRESKETERNPAPPKDARVETEPSAAAETRSGELSLQAYERVLVAEIRKHAPKTSHGRAGLVKIAFTVGAAGRVVSHRVEQSSDPRLAEIAVEALASIHTPPPPGGKYWAVQQFNFH